MSSRQLIRMRGIVKRFYIGQPNELEILHGIDLDVKEGEFVSIVGASGSGKSTLMNMIGVLDRPTEGTYWLDGTDVQDAQDDELSQIRNRKIGFVFQNFNLFPQYTALQNVMLAGELLAKERPDYKANKKAIHAELEAQARELLAQMGLSERALRISQVYLLLLLWCAINRTQTLEYLSYGWLIYTESIHYGGCAHDEDSCIPEEVLVAKILLGGFQVWFLMKLIYTIYLLVTGRRCTKITLYITISRLRTSWLHAKGYNTVGLASKLECRNNNTSELITVGNNMIGR